MLWERRPAGPVCFPAVPLIPAGPATKASAVAACARYARRFSRAEITRKQQQREEA